MDKVESTEKQPLPEITKEVVTDRIEHYVRMQTSHYKNGKFKKAASNQIRNDWMAGFLSHAELLEPHNEAMRQTFENVLAKLDRAKELVLYIEHGEFKCEAGPLSQCGQYIELKEILSA